MQRKDECWWMHHDHDDHDGTNGFVFICMEGGARLEQMKIDFIHMEGDKDEGEGGDEEQEGGGDEGDEGDVEKVSAMRPG